MEWAIGAFFLGYIVFDWWYRTKALRSWRESQSRPAPRRQSDPWLASGLTEREWEQIRGFWRDATGEVHRRSREISDKVDWKTEGF